MAGKHVTPSRPGRHLVTGCHLCDGDVPAVGEHPRVGCQALDGAGGTVDGAQEAHDARARATPGQLLVLPPDGRHVRPGARAALEQPGLTLDEVHDRVGADELVAHRQDEAVVDDDALGNIGLVLVDVEVVDGAPEALTARRYHWRNGVAADGESRRHSLVR